MANIKDVASKAGVGIATVSRVINNSGYVKKETREKVERVIKEIEYIPNEIARSMTLQKNKIVAFILPNITHLFFGELSYYVEQELFEHGYKLMICNSSEQIAKEIVYLEMLKNNRVDAVILLTNNDVESLIDKNKPVVSFDRKFKDVPFVASDNYRGGVMAAKKLLELRVKETEYWHNGDRDSEILFIKKLKYFYKKYEPIFVTWNDDFYEKTKEFVELIKVTSIADEGGDPIDWHPGSKGCYDFYLKLHEFLNIDELVVEFENKKNKLI